MSRTPQMPPPGKLAVSVLEMAALIGVSENTAYDLTCRADFPVVQLGTRKLIPVDALKQWLAGQVQKNAPTGGPNSSEGR